MAHKPSYTFSLQNNRVLQFKHNTSIQIARLHSFSKTKSKNIFTNTIAFHENLLACSSQDGEIVVVNIYTRKKSIIKTSNLHIETLRFLDKNILLISDLNGSQVYDLRSYTLRDINSPSILALLNRQKNIDLKTLSSSFLKPLIDEKSLALAFELVDNNPMLRTTPEHNKIEEMYRVVFTQAIEELRKGKKNSALRLLEGFKDINSKKEEMNALFIDFKHYERFKLHISEEKYSIAYALCSKHSLLMLTPEFKEMEDIYNEAFKLAQEQMLMNQKELATQTLSQYITILSKRSQIKNLLSGDYSYDNSSKEKSEAEIQNEIFLHAYNKKSFKECYEIIDNYSMEDLELVTLLEKHWVKLMIECENHALNGDIKAIKRVLGELISTKTRVDKIGDLLRVAFYSKIKTLHQSKKFSTAENIIYSYIDIFGMDIEIKEIMKEFEKGSSKKLALTHHEDEKVLRSDWLNAAIIVES
ncbi:MAG: hypothetical protein ABFQ64_05560 [Campylobacterota bacterium]